MSRTLKADRAAKERWAEELARSPARPAAHDRERPADRTAVHAGRSQRLRRRDRPRISRPVPVHARRAREHVPRAAVDDAAVRRVRYAATDQRAVQVPAGEGADRALDRVRPAHADGPRQRRSARGGRGRPARRGDGHARRHARAVRRHQPGKDLGVHDHQRAGDRHHGVLPGRRPRTRLRLPKAPRHAPE